jgi:hypothetical protein
MKTHLLGALVGLAISFALPTFAQQTTADPQLRQQLLALAKKFEDAWNNKKKEDRSGHNGLPIRSATNPSGGGRLRSSGEAEWFPTIEQVRAVENGVDELRKSTIKSGDNVVLWNFYDVANKLTLTMDTKANNAVKLDPVQSRERPEQKWKINYAGSEP